MSEEKTPHFLWALFNQLRRRGFPLGPDDFDALRQALRAGFGWSSHEALRDLCAALWAKSRRDQEVLAALFDQYYVPTWELPESELQPRPSPLPGSAMPVAVSNLDRGIPEEPVPSTPPVTEESRGLPPVSLEGVKVPLKPFVLIPQYPLTYREVAQAWRRLRRSVRFGPKTELDIEATVDYRSRHGIVSEVIMVPRRRNTIRLLLLIDRFGSMTPFHDFVAEVCAAIQESGNFSKVSTYFFHDLPAEGADDSVLTDVSDQIFLSLDPVLAEISPLSEGIIYTDSELSSIKDLHAVLDSEAEHATVVIVSDAGAARGTYDSLRLLDTVAFFKGLRTYTKSYVWLNPLPPRYWESTTASQIARHVPMFPISRRGMFMAVNFLRGQPYWLESPL